VFLTLVLVERFFHFWQKAGQSRRTAMKRGERVRVELSADSEFQGRTGTVDADSLGGWVQVSLDDEAVSHQFKIEELERID
jgi:membrane protein implicated in regulation of membrane protease activity